MTFKRVGLAVLCAALACSGIVTVAHFTRPKPRTVTIRDDMLPVVPADAPETGFSPNDIQSPPSTAPAETSLPTASQSPALPSGAEQPSMSSDGSVVAWISAEAVPGEKEPVHVVIVRDRRTQRTEQVSVSSSGAPANGSSDAPVVSADGTHVAFVSEASNLVPNDLNGVTDVFVRDLARGTTTRASVASSGREGNGSSGGLDEVKGYRFSRGPSISGDGSLVVFESSASNLVDGDSNGLPDVFVHELATGKTTLVSATPSGTPGSDASAQPALSLDGGSVAFTSRARDLVSGGVQTAAESDLQVFVRSLATGTTVQVSLSDDGAALSGASYLPVLDGNAHHVAFATTNWEGKGDAAIVLRDLQAGTNGLVGTACDFYEGCWDVAMSADASVVAWGGSPGGVDPHVWYNGTSTWGSTLGPGGDVEVSPDGRYIAFDGDDPYNDNCHLYGDRCDGVVYDRQTERYSHVDEF